MIGEKTYLELSQLGIKKIKTLQSMSVDMVEHILGKNGKKIWNKAQGVDHSPVIQYSEKKSVSRERTFDKDTIDFFKLKGVLVAMTENLASELHRDKKLVGRITVKIRYVDFNTHTLQKSISYTASDHILIPKIQELFARLYDKRLLVRLVGVRFSSLVGGCIQMSLFDEDESVYSLYSAIDKIKDSYGAEKIMRASALDSKFRNYTSSFQGERNKSA